MYRNRKYRSGTATLTSRKPSNVNPNNSTQSNVSVATASISHISHALTDRENIIPEEVDDGNGSLVAVEAIPASQPKVQVRKHGSFASFNPHTTYFSFLFRKLSAIVHQNVVQSRQRPYQPAKTCQSVVTCPSAVYCNAHSPI